MVLLRSHWQSNKAEVVAENGVVTAMQPQAAEAGLAILKQGGKAVDAAVATGFCNIVLEPYMAVIGGMGYMLIHLAETGCTIGVDFNGRAPRRAHAEMYDVLGPAPPGGINVFRTRDDANVSGALSITVPATCAGFCTAHEQYGRLPLEQVLESAIGLAADGFETNWHTTLYVANRMEALQSDPYLAEMWLPNGRPPRSYPKPAERIVQHDLGELLRRIARHGAAAMYAGEVADAIDAWMRTHDGVLTKQDLADYQPMVGAPLTQDFHGQTLACVATPSGAVTNLETFQILNHLAIDDLQHNSTTYLHLVIEAARHAFADRFRYLGDWEHAPRYLYKVYCHRPIRKNWPSRLCRRGLRRPLRAARNPGAITSIGPYMTPGRLIPAPARTRFRNPPWRPRRDIPRTSMWWIKTAMRCRARIRARLARSIPTTPACT